MNINFELNDFSTKAWFTPSHNDDHRPAMIRKTTNSILKLQGSRPRARAVKITEPVTVALLRVRCAPGFAAVEHNNWNEVRHKGY